MDPPSPAATNLYSKVSGSKNTVASLSEPSTENSFTGTAILLTTLPRSVANAAPGLFDC